MFRKIKRYLCLHFPRYKLYCIRRALNLRPIKWQTEYALGHGAGMPPHEERQNGKTTAVMLRMLMQDPKYGPVWGMLVYDPDYIPTEHHRFHWYRHEYMKLTRICTDAGIPVPPAIAWCKL
jgi:hypothetical protein